MSLFLMGGYGLYVWPAYGITLLVFATNLCLALHEKRQTKKMIKHYLLQRTRHEP